MSDWERAGPGLWHRQVTPSLLAELQADIGGWNVRILRAGSPVVRLSVVGSRSYAKSVADELGQQYGQCQHGL